MVTSRTGCPPGVSVPPWHQHLEHRLQEDARGIMSAAALCGGVRADEVERDSALPPAENSGAPCRRPCTMRGKREERVYEDESSCSKAPDVAARSGRLDHAAHLNLESYTLQE